MPDILQDFPVNAPVDRVFAAVSTAAGLNCWWTETCDGRGAVGEEYALGFGTDFQWRAVVSAHTPPSCFELTLLRADADWAETRVRFELTPDAGATHVQFAHLGWPTVHAHFRVSSHCWALYLRLLRRYLEHDEIVPYADRLGA
jgi:uncharacterized protein YndB with AHSA1/START domain